MLNQVLMYFIIYTCLYHATTFDIIFKEFHETFYQSNNNGYFLQHLFQTTIFCKAHFCFTKKIGEGTTTYGICWPISTYEIVLTFLMLWKTFFQSRKFIIFAKIFVDDNHLQKWRGTYDNVWTFPINTWWLNIKEK